MVWMTSKDSTRDLTTRIPGFTGNFRGTHYTFADVTNPDAPVLGIEDWQKVEAQRAGWPSLVQYADDLGLDSRQLLDCMSSQKYRDEAAASANEAVSLGLNATPSILVNGVKMENPFDYDELKRLIADAQAQAQ